MIYLDHAATTPLRPEAREAMRPFLDGTFGNPSGLYSVGREAQGAVDEARRAVAACLNARPAEIIFTSGGTESINAAVHGIGYAMRRAGAGPHQHHGHRASAGLHVAQYLEELGFQVTYLGCDAHGRVQVEEFEQALRPQTVLASVMLANNEVGTVQPIAEIGALLRERARTTGERVLLHTDAVQAPGWLPLDVNALGVDALSLSSHKFGGPKGSGILFLRRATPFRQLLHGGGQEMQKRAGTENVAGIVGTGAALRLATTGVEARSRRIRALREHLRDGVLARISGVVANGCQENCLPNNLNVAFDGVESDLLVRGLDTAGVAVSSGSACSNSTWEPSHVLMAMGVPIRQVVGSIRFSLGESTTAEEIDAVLELLPGLVDDARAQSMALTR
jgi:cysteine desulfurase